MNNHNIFLKLFIVLIFFFSGISSISQTYEEIIIQMQGEYEDFKKKNEEKFNNYVQQIDKDFSDYLKQAWEEYELFAADKRKTEPKPPVAPKYDKEKDKTSHVEIEHLLLISPNIIQKLQPELPGVKKIEPENFEKFSDKINFYGSELKYNYDKNFKLDIPNSINEIAISNYWDKMSETNYNHFIDQLLNFKKDYNLNDWGYYILIKDISSRIYPDSENGANLLTWFLLTRSRYKAKVAFKDNEVFLMLPSNNIIYGKNYYIFNDLKYYVLNKKIENIQTFNKDFPETDIILDLNLYYPINVGSNVSQKTLKFKDNGEEYLIKINYKPDAINFYKDYPLADIKIYFDAAISPEAKESIIENLRPIVKDKSEAEAVNFLLKFVQTAFEYKTDQEYFGYEKFYFPEEVIYYPYSDCEDRSVLFSYLVKELLGLEVIGLEYEGHMATAINFNDKVEGDYIKFKGEKYTVADPTFINAPAGLIMPEYSKTKPKVIELKNLQNNRLEQEKVWEWVRKADGFRGDNKDDIGFDEDGNAYVTGYFAGEVNFNGKILSGNIGERDVFIAKYDKNGNVIWAESITGKGNDIAYNLKLDNEGNIFISGTFNEDLNFNGNKLQTTGQSDVFVAKFNKDGDFIWANKAGVDKLDHSVNFMFAAKFDREGTKTMAKLYNETENFNNYGLALDNSGNVYITGSFFSTTGMNVNRMSYDAGSKFNPSSSLKSENDKLLNEDYEKTIAGLFAAMKLLKINTLEIPGISVQEVLNKHNPDFKNFATVFYNSFGKITFMKNSGGIITIKINDGKSIIFNKIKINNNARIKVAHYKSGNAQVDIFSGIYVGKNRIWYDMNFIKIYKNSGDLLLDYDDDHTQKKLNLKTEILIR